MPVGRTHRAQIRLPIQIASIDRSRCYSGHTVDISTGGFSAELQTDDHLPTIVEAMIEGSSDSNTHVVCKGHMAWQGGLLRGLKRASYRIISISQPHRDQIEGMVRGSIQRLVADLGDLPIFAGVNIFDLEHLLALARVREAEPNSSLYEMGRFEGAGVYLMLDGRIALERPGHSAGLGRGRLFGRWAAPEIAAHDESARALNAIRFLYLPAPLHREMALVAPELAGALRNALGQKPETPADVMRRSRKMSETIPAAQ